MRRAPKNAGLLVVVAAMVAALLALPGASVADSTTAAQPFDHVTITITLKGKLTGRLAIRLTRGIKVYARGTKAVARPGKNVITAEVTRELFPGKYTLRWIFTPRNGTKASRGAKIVTVAESALATG